MGSNNDKTIRHFCTHALDDIIDVLNSEDSEPPDRVPSSLMDANVTSLINYNTYCRDGVVMLRDAIKFHCEIEELKLVSRDITKEWLVQEDPQLPFDTVAIEVGVRGEDPENREYIKGIKGVIFLCQMLYCTPPFIRKQILEDLDLESADEGFLVWPIQQHSKELEGALGAANDRWWFAPCIGVAVPGSTLKIWETSHSHQIHTAGNSNPDETLDNLMHILDDKGLYAALAEHAKKQDEDPIKMWKDQIGIMGESLQHDMHLAAALFALLEASNVTTTVTAVPLKLNKRREKKKRTPFFEYRVLEIDLFTPKVASIGLGLGDHRQSPKMHMRRGHPRILKDGRAIKIPAMIVGDKNRGFILKDYEILPRKGDQDG